jgi:hypothetical protein
MALPQHTDPLTRLIHHHGTEAGDILAHDAHIQGIRGGNLFRQKTHTGLCIHMEPVACLLACAAPSRPCQRAAYAMVQVGQLALTRDHDREPPGFEREEMGFVEG